MIKFEQYLVTEANFLRLPDARNNRDGTARSKTNITKAAAVAAVAGPPVAQAVPAAKTLAAKPPAPVQAAAAAREAATTFRIKEIEGVPYQPTPKQAWLLAKLQKLIL